MNPSAGSYPRTLRNGWTRDRVDQGQTPGFSTAEAEEITKLHKENHQLRRANETLRKASAFVAAELETLHDEMIRFIEESRGHVGVGAICRAVGATECGFITSWAYRAAKTRPACARAVRNEILPDLVERKFIAERPDQLRVADITYVKNLTGLCLVAFITDICPRRIVG